MLALATIAPFVYVFLQPINLDPNVEPSPSWVLVSFVLFLLAVHIVLVVKSTALRRRDKFGWIFSLIFFFPFASLAMIYYLYWHKPIRVATNLDEQIEILRELRMK